MPGTDRHLQPHNCADVIHGSYKLHLAFSSKFSLERSCCDLYCMIDLQSRRLPAVLLANMGQQLVNQLAK
jgi:hypothetical protein